MTVPEPPEVGAFAVKRSRAALKRVRREAAELPAGLQASAHQLLERPEGRSLHTYEHRILSSRGEDGITIEILRRIGIRHRKAVELGCGANGGNVGVLVAGLGFEGLLVDGDEELVGFARSLFAGYPATVVQGWIARDTVSGLLSENGFDMELDYLGLDLDGIDYWIWDALPARARIVVCEYNPFFGPKESLVIPYDPEFVRATRDDHGNFVHAKSYYGASLRALVSLGRGKGYRLVSSVPHSHNVYFLREDVAADLPALSVAAAFQPPVKGKDGTPHQRERYERIQKQGAREYYERLGAPLITVEGPGRIRGQILPRLARLVGRRSSERGAK